MHNISSCSSEDSVCMGVDSTENEDTEDEVQVVKERMASTPRYERCPKIGPALMLQEVC